MTEVESHGLRQHKRLASGIGYSFAVAETVTDQSVGQIGLWLHDHRHGRASLGYSVLAAEVAPEP